MSYPVTGSRQIVKLFCAKRPFCEQVPDDVFWMVILIPVLQPLWLGPKCWSHSGFTSGLTLLVPDWLRKGGLLHTFIHPLFPLIRFKCVCVCEWYLICVNGFIDLFALFCAKITVP